MDGWWLDGWDGWSSGWMIDEYVGWLGRWMIGGKKDEGLID